MKNHDEIIAQTAALGANGAPAGPAQSGFNDAAWVEVLRAVDKTYTELVAYQEELEARNAELDALRRFMGSVFSSMSDVVLVVGRDGEVEEASGALEDILGTPGHFAVGRPLSELVSPQARAAVEAAIWDVIDTRAPGSIEADLTGPSGPTPLEFSIAPRIGKRGKSLGAVLIGRPLGEMRRAYSELEESHRQLKEAQTHLVRNEKLASLGRLLAGVAHELNNPISFVYANAHAMEKSASKLETYFDAVHSGAPRADLANLRAELKLDREMTNLRLALEGARDGSERVRDIVEDLRRLSADGQGEMTGFCLATTTKVAANWVLRGTKREVKITTSGPDTLRAFGRVGHIQQVIMNLFQNAVDAVEGVLDPELQVSLGEENEMVFVRITDNGPGIGDDIAASVFDPFFTTKEVGKGTGLGLSISHKIAEEHGGELTLCTPDGGGACFTLSLPFERYAISGRVRPPNGSKEIPHV
jgi:two-component system sensor histidine kinase HupT/HoxJ